MLNAWLACFQLDAADASLVAARELITKNDCDIKDVYSRCLL